MHVPPAVRRWGTRLGLAIVVAMVIGYLPGQVLQRDPRTVTLERQLGELETEEGVLTGDNAELLRAIEALRSDVGAIEARARADLGMAYPDELVLRIAPPAGQVTP
ncbi:MAG: hypothetical protein JWP01_937 [Myxococcales bacterium]|nr:hypothetical protein [Myxococcales bacterium]